MTKNVTAMLAAVAIAFCVSGTAHADTNLIQNGGFEDLTNGAGQLGYNTNATGWSTNGYNFVFTPGTADTNVVGSDGNLSLWGPNNGSANGLTGSPDGGNFVGADGAYEVGAITQTVTGLTVGQKYNVSFDWGAAQQSGYTGDTSDLWTVSLGDESYNTGTYQLPNHGFSGWQNQTFQYTATSNTEVLSFLATGTPSGEPPFALLDGVKMNAVPEASTTVAMCICLFGFGLFVRRARANKVSA